MKTIIISFIAIIMISMVGMSFNTKATNKNVILIQAIDNQVTSTSLNEAASIISARLKDFSTDKSIVTVIPEKHQIQVDGINDNDKDIKSVENLIIQKGRIEFYITYNELELLGLLKGDRHLFSLLNTMEIKNTDSRIGCTFFSQMDKVNQFINSNESLKNCRFVWSDFKDSTNVCLLALRTAENNGSLLTGNDIESVTYNKEKAHNNWYTEFSFKKTSSKVWSEITRQYINHSVAIVIDNHVICYPVIRSVIENGKCMITGNFTETDVKLFAAFGSHGELPATFEVVR
jgi:preprotein translocase subunit SecD